MARLSRRSKWIVILGALITAVVVIVVRQLTISNGPPALGSPAPTAGAAPTGTGAEPSGATGTAAPIPGQDIYKAMLKRDVQALDRGVLAYSPIGSLKTGNSTAFDVSITDVGRGAQETTVTKVGGQAVFQQDVPTGGIVGIKIVDCQNLMCDSESSVTQPVLSRGDKATWWWQITARRPGSAEIKLRVDTYDQGSQQTLSEEIVPVAAKVVPTAAWEKQQSQKNISNATKSGVNLVVTLGSLAGAIVAVGTVVGWLVNRARKRKRATSNASQDDAAAAGSSKNTAPS